MAIYEIQADKIVSFDVTTFEAVGLRERNDLQRLLNAQIEIVCPDVLVISEGFREWEDSRRELDLLALDKQANLVVIELKRTEDGGHAELQAIRYAAMVSAMTFSRAVDVYDDYLRKNGRDADAASELLKFLDWDEPDEDTFVQDVRIVLVSADFSKELTTSVMWLNERNLDIRCVRMRPYRDGSRVLVDVQQVIPLPEASEYIVRIREKAVRERQDKAERESRHSLRQAFWQALLDRVSGKSQLFSSVSASDGTWISAGSGVTGVHFTYRVRQHTAASQVYLEADKDVNKARFDWLMHRREQIEAAINGTVEWQRCDDLKQSYLSVNFDGGYRETEEEWAAVQDKMIAAMSELEQAIKPLLAELRQVVPVSSVLGESAGLHSDTSRGDAE